MKALLLVFSCVLLAGCSCDSKPSKVRIEPETSIVANQFLMDAEDLDLSLILGHLKEGGEGINDPEALEKWINTTPGVNNVDLDRDEKIDLITVKEQEGQEKDTSVLALLANPADGSEATVVAELQFTVLQNLLKLAHASLSRTYLVPASQSSVSFRPSRRNQS
jgi:hypothetical protein